MRLNVYNQSVKDCKEIEEFQAMKNYLKFNKDDNYVPSVHKATDASF
jgi:hypothetical protein